MEDFQTMCTIEREQKYFTIYIRSWTWTQKIVQL